MKQSATTKAALPEMLTQDDTTVYPFAPDTGAHKRYAIEVIRIGIHGTKQERIDIAAELVLRWNSHEQMREALADCATELDKMKLPSSAQAAYMRAKSALAQLERPA